MQERAGLGQLIPAPVAQEVGLGLGRVLPRFQRAPVDQLAEPVLEVQLSQECASGGLRESGAQERGQLVVADSGERHGLLLGQGVDDQPILVGRGNGQEVRWRQLAGEAEQIPPTQRLTGTVLDRNRFRQSVLLTSATP